jgi:hypothetical protein
MPRDASAWPRCAESQPRYSLSRNPPFEKDDFDLARAALQRFQNNAHCLDEWLGRDTATQLIKVVARSRHLIRWNELSDQFIKSARDEHGATNDILQSEPRPDRGRFERSAAKCNRSSKRWRRAAVLTLNPSCSRQARSSGTSTPAIEASGGRSIRSASEGVKTPSLLQVFCSPAGHVARSRSAARTLLGQSGHLYPL